MESFYGIEEALKALNETTTTSGNLTFTNISKKDEAQAADYLLERFEKELYENDIKSVIRKVLEDPPPVALKAAIYKILDEELDKGLLANQGNRIYTDQFAYVTQLTQIDIPKNIKIIGNWAFNSCTGLTSITIPSSVTNIGFAAFEQCANLVSATIPNGVKRIGDYAFSECTSLSSVNIPNSVTNIGEAAFKKCESLSSVTIPNSVTSIGHSAFERCTGLTSVIIPNSVMSIGFFTFYNCTDLVEIIYQGTKEQWSKIDKEKDWDSGTGNYTIHCTDGDITK